MLVFWALFEHMDCQCYGWILIYRRCAHWAVSIWEEQKSKYLKKGKKREKQRLSSSWRVILLVLTTGGRLCLLRKAKATVYRFCLATTLMSCVCATFILYAHIIPVLLLYLYQKNFIHIIYRSRGRFQSLTFSRQETRISLLRSRSKKKMQPNKLSNIFLNQFKQESIV